MNHSFPTADPTRVKRACVDAATTAKQRQQLLKPVQLLTPAQIEGKRQADTDRSLQRPIDCRALCDPESGPFRP